MTGVDVTLVVVLVLFALRGFWRGIFRESFGLAALVGAVLAALQLTAAGEAALQSHVKLPPPIPAGIAFVAIFVIVYTAINFLGAMLDWVAGTSPLRSINGAAGALFGLAKGAAVVAFVLLFLHLFPIAGTVDARVMRSSIGRAMVAAASSLIRLGLSPGASPGQT